MEAGCYGRLESVIPPITVPAWLCMATSQDPGSLGLYGFRNRKDHSYEGLETVDSHSSRALTIWDQVAREGGRSVLVGVPPSFPPRKVNGVSVGCFLTPDPARDTYTHPPELAKEIEALVGDYAVDVKGFRTSDKDWLHRQILDMTGGHFEVVRHLIGTREWAYLQFVEIGLDRVHHGFWKHHDERHVDHDSRSPYREVVRDYYRYLDREIGSVLELIPEDTVVMILSDHGARPLDGGFCVNEWLVREGLLALRAYPGEVTPFEELDVDWSRTTAWSSGGYYARVFLNVKGREPHGTIEPGEYEQVRSELAAKLASTTAPDGAPLGTRVFKPEEVYRHVRGVAPDLIVHFGDLAWRAIGGVGYPGLHVRENDTGPDDCNHAQHGAFVLAGAGVPALGELTDVHLLDVAPTLLSLAGYEVPAEMQGRALLGRVAPRSDEAEPDREERDRVIRERLRGLGYLG
jgi:predicted AlkP superfamily phosphohydrolase/phosphomutase